MQCVIQVLAQNDDPLRKFHWVDSGPHEVPMGAVVAGRTGDGRLLYTAQAGGEAGNYDVTKNCAEFASYTYEYACYSSWKILVVTHCEYWNAAFRGSKKL